VVRNLKILCIALVLMAVVPMVRLTASGETAGTYTLKQAIDSAMQNNAEIQLLDERIKLAEARYQEVMDDVGYAKNRKSNKPEQEVQYRKQELIDPMNAELQLYELGQQKKDLMLEVRLQVENIFYRYKLAQEQLASANNELKALNNRYANQKKLVETGRGVASSLDSLEIERLKLEQRLAQLESQREMLLVNLASETGQGRSRFVSLELRNVPETSYSVDNLEKLVSQVKEKHPSIKLAQKKVDITAKEYEITQQAYMHTLQMSDVMKTAEDNSFSTRLKLRDAQIQAEVKVRTDYLSILNLADDVQIAKLQKERSAKALDMTAKRHKLGVVTDAELEQAQLQAASAETALLQAKLDLHMAVERYKYYVSNEG
jgi:outer membrane protein TolC